ncbi:TIGR01777 family oxidoreductase [Litoribacter alkaliphilus]|uniref:TIGR01777 family oxidoreductase n=1 Tax=Litoribacter ruber TaxID=702568 RepID=A0AAP2G659_9BACT|nr:TIGR01777 family oxidoreductase [Litoribacter alkaliphilus]MBS9525338.1 TIGR01777 family oxidoreductase [Litoribacter alkaliphilus]
MKKILITGGSGLVGKKITEQLEREDYEVAWLSRSPKEGRKTFIWDVEKQEIDPYAMRWADAIIHLAGAGVADKRWTEKRKREILDSRVESTRLLFEAARTEEEKPKVIVSASAVGYYGMDTGDTLLNEEDKPGDDFLAEVVKKWEKEVKHFESLHIRTVMLRIGIVLASEGGALSEILRPPVAAPLGTGEQFMSWIHLSDLARMFRHALFNDSVHGVYNAVGPKPVTNRELTEKAAKAKGKPFVNVGVPKAVLRVVLGEMAQMVLGGNKVSSLKIQSAGYKFRYNDIGDALGQLFYQYKE